MAIRKAGALEDSSPSLSTEDILLHIRQHPRSLRRDMTREWVLEASEELGKENHDLLWLREEVLRAFAHNK